MIRIISILFTGLMTGLEILFRFLSSLVPEKRSTEYTADFLRAGEAVSAYNKGFCINGTQSLTIDDSLRHVLVLGSSGSMKSAGILIPSILKMRGHCSFVINDPTGELLKCASALKDMGYEIKTLNYNKPEESEGYNPLLRATKSASGIEKVAKMLLATSLGTGGKDPFWNLAAESLTALITRYILKCMDNQYHTLANVHFLCSLLSYAPEQLDRMFAKSHDTLLLSEYKSFISYGDKTLASIIATCRSGLSIFANDPNVALVTSHDTIDFSEFKKRKIALFINNNVTDMRYYSVITSIFLEQFFAEIMSSIPDRKTSLPIFFLIDEASSLRFNSLQITLAAIRKHFAGILQVYQSPAQIVDLYNAAVARALTENSYTRIYMPGQHIQTAAELEAAMGKFEFQDSNNVRHVRSLLSASEIRELTQSLVFIGSKRPIKTETIPYFKQYAMRRLTELPLYQPTNKLPFATPPLIKIEA